MKATYEILRQMAANEEGSLNRFNLLVAAHGYASGEKKLEVESLISFTIIEPEDICNKLKAKAKAFLVDCKRH